MQYGIEMSQDITIPKPDDAEAQRFEFGGAAAIALDLLRMLAAVEFDHEPPVDAAEVDDERSERLLAAKLESSKLAVAQLRPKQALGIGLPPAQMPCSVPQNV